MKKSGIYIIYNWTTDEFYIGSSVKLLGRFRTHLSELRGGKHGNYKIQAAFNRGDVLTWSIMDYCQADQTLDSENRYFTEYSPTLNIAKDASAPMLGRKHSEATLELYKGRVPWNVNIERTEEEKELMSVRRKEAVKNQSPETKARVLELRKAQVGYWNGKNIPEETKTKVRESHLKLTKTIVCVTTGIEYLCQNDAAKDLGIKQGHISEHLKGKRPNVKGYKFEYKKS